MAHKLLGIIVKKQSKQEVLEDIKKYTKNGNGFFHIVSLNPENFVIVHQNEEFKKTVEEGQIKIIDGIGVVAAAWLLNIPIGQRITGVDLMVEMLSLANRERLRVMLIGGSPKVAEKVVECQKEIYPNIEFFSLEGFKDIRNPQKSEENDIFSIVASRKPHFFFAAFGSPRQELWMYKNRHKLEGMVCMGVGGAFDFLSGGIVRAPAMLRRLGLEWLFRLFSQPWRIKRQFRLVRFMILVMAEKLR